MKLICHASHAINDRDSWNSYVNGHAKVLLDFGIEVLTSYGDEWINNPSVYLITVKDELNNIVGGIKVHKMNENFKLPVQYAIGDLSNEINQIINDSRQHGVGEICGLWISKDFGRRGIAHFLSRVAIAICKPLDIKIIYGISSPFTLNMFYALGYEKMSELGKDGNFNYPTEEFISTAVMIQDTFNLPLASEFHHARIKSLRDNPIQSSIEEHLGNYTIIEYNLSSIVP